MRIAIIGTAGRDKSKQMDKNLWHWMIEDAKFRIPTDAHLISGGAAWADHLAVWLFLNGYVKGLTLHLPAPFDRMRNQFIGPHSSSASAANYYHRRFSQAININTLVQIAEVAAMDGCDGSFEPEAAGYGGMFARNNKVAKADAMYAYTFGTGDEPADGGTKDTWNKCQGQRIHVPLPQ